MKQFNIYFFLENNGERIQRDKILADIHDYFITQRLYRIEYFENEGAVAFYQHPRLPFGCRFIITKTSALKSTRPLSSKFIEINLRLAIDFTTPNYIAKHFLDLARDGVCRAFNLYAFNEALEDVSTYDTDIMLKIFGGYKQILIEKLNPELSRLHKMNRDKFDIILRYLDRKHELERHYKENDRSLVAVPDYLYLRSDDNRIVLAMNWYDVSPTVFPPYVDYIYFNVGELLHLYDAGELFKVLDDYLESIPGFMNEAKMISRDNLKKAIKTIKKSRIVPKMVRFKRVDLNEIIDY